MCIIYTHHNYFLNNMLFYIMNCNDRTDGASALNVIKQTSFKKYKNKIDNEWKTYADIFKKTYGNNSDKNYYECANRNLSNILQELKNATQGLDNIIDNNDTALTKRLTELNLDTKIDDLTTLNEKYKQEKSKNTASFPMKQDIYDLNSKEYLYFSFYVMSIFTMIYFINIQVKQ
jgi:hypothetical protein